MMVVEVCCFRNHEEEKGSVSEMEVEWAVLPRTAGVMRGA